MRKLRTFYGKVTEFLNEDKITCLQRLGVNARIGLYRRAEQTVYLYSMIGYLCKSLSGCGMHISSIELPNLDKKPEKHPLASLQYMEKDYQVIFYCYLRVLEKLFYLMFSSSKNILFF